MREEGRKSSKSSWSKLAVGKFLNIGTATACRDDFQFDHKTKGIYFQKRRKSFSGDGHKRVVVPEDQLSEEWLTDHIGRSGFGHVTQLVGAPVACNLINLRMLVGTWNVGGKSPNDDHGASSNIMQWLKSTKDPADIYVLGFQEIVPLNAQNVIGREDSGPGTKWLALIGDALNPNHYYLVASKQMVGIFLCVWARRHLSPHLAAVKASCVGTGIMGCLGNKGSVSISLTLYQTSFCFVCTHLQSGDREGSETRRNLDVAEIFKRTRFSSTFSPANILDHDNIIWLGDLNYRLTAISNETFKLLENGDWQALLKKDQLRIEQKAGRVLQDWEEGDIYFAPTYKYLIGSDRYAYAAQASSSKEKCRTPAWCDRILWKGKGLKQMLYARGESSFSDHRPVYSLFSMQLRLGPLGFTAYKNWACNRPNLRPLEDSSIYHIQLEK